MSLSGMKLRLLRLDNISKGLLTEGPAAAMIKKRIKLNFSTQFSAAGAVPVTGALYLFMCFSWN